MQHVYNICIGLHLLPGYVLNLQILMNMSCSSVYHDLVLFLCQLHLAFFRDDPGVVNVLNSISAAYDYIINGDKATLISPCSPCPWCDRRGLSVGQYGIRLNSNRPLWQVKVVRCHI